MNGYRKNDYKKHRITINTETTIRRKIIAILEDIWIGKGTKKLERIGKEKEVGKRM